MQEPYAIIGLGNPGPRYARNRHNVGFICLDSFAQTHGFSWKPDAKRAADLGQGNLKGKKTYLVKPVTFMNLSGESARKVLAYYQIPMTNLLVIYDDVDIPFGKLRFRPSGSAGSHNGMKSMVVELGTDQFARLRIGVGEPPPEWDIQDYVLGNFSKTEEPQLEKIIDTAVEAVSFWMSKGTEAAMNQYNALTLS